MPSQENRAHPEQQESGNVVELTPDEEKEVKRRTALRAEVVFETIRREGESELNRPALALAFSGLAAGLSMGFSLVAAGALRASIPLSGWRPLVEGLGYTVGFVIVVLGRQQLYTENTLTALLPVLDDEDKPKKLLQMLRLWIIVLLTNLIGAAIFAYLVAKTPIFSPGIKSAFLAMGLEALKPAWSEIFWRGLLAGWILALMVWLLPAAKPQRLWVIVMMTWMIAAASLGHVIAGSVFALYAVSAGAWAWTGYISGFLIPALIGNTIGGVVLVAILNYGQIAPEHED